MDVIGPVPTSMQGNSWALVVIKRDSNQSFAKPAPNKRAETMKEKDAELAELRGALADVQRREGESCRQVAEKSAAVEGLEAKVTKLEASLREVQQRECEMSAASADAASVASSAASCAASSSRTSAAAFSCSVARRSLVRESCRRRRCVTFSHVPHACTA